MCVFIVSSSISVHLNSLLSYTVTCNTDSNVNDKNSFVEGENVDVDYRRKLNVFTKKITEEL